MSRTDDTELIERCRSGDRQAFEALLVKYEKPVFNAAYRMLNLKVFESFDQFDPTRRFFSWIYRITLNESINWLSKMNRLEPLAFEAADEGKGPEQEVDSARVSRDVQAALMTIKTDYRSVVILKHFLGCSYMEMN
jgi:RNA polymerase sigma-70 factor (ECF subfamily)